MGKYNARIFVVRQNAKIIANKQSFRVEFDGV